MVETCVLDVSDGLARIELRRPDRGNALDLDLAARLAQAVGQVAVHPEVRAVLLTGAGARFCVGGDIGPMRAADDPGEYLRELAGLAHYAILGLHDLAVPVVCAVQGAAAGAGLALTLVSDVVVAAETAKFVCGYPGIGLTPDCGTTWMLPRHVGARRALEMTLLNRRLSAQEACSWGLVTRVVDDGDVAREAVELAGSLAAAGPLSGATRRLVRDSASVELRDHLAARGRSYPGRCTHELMVTPPGPGSGGARPACVRIAPESDRNA